MNRYVGLKQSRRAIEEGIVVKAFIAEDSDDGLRNELLMLCSDRDIPIENVPTMKQLGAECGIDKGASIAVITK